MLISSRPLVFNFKYDFSLMKTHIKSVLHLLLIYNHAVADGISGVILTNQILETYSKLQNNEELDSTVTRVKIGFIVIKTYQSYASSVIET